VTRYVPALGYRALTRFYDPFVALTTRERRFKRRLLRAARISGGRILDMGCGTGTLSVWAKEAHPATEVVGVDGDAEILKIARKKAERAGVEVRFDRAMAHDLPYPDASFQRVLSSLLFHHLDHDGKGHAVREVFRVLEPGGGVQLLDGFENTRDNVEGRLPSIFTQAGFREVDVLREYATVHGTLTLYRARKPKENGQEPRRWET
jgi:ubiquinone/menaquinone biosynthesis C-methylase UbiE